MTQHLPTFSSSRPGGGHLRHQALGAQLLSADMAGHGEIFYLSPIAASASAPARGGVPVLFPQFAEAGPLRKHGYVRDMPWTLHESRTEADVEAFCYTLNIGEHDYPQWPHGASMVLKAELHPDQLRIELAIHNTGTSAFSFTGGLHPYFRLADLLQMRIEGLQGVAIRDRYRPELLADEAPSLKLDSQPFERLYDGCPDLQLWTGELRLTLSASGFDQWMIWNPGEAGAKQLADLPDADWQRFVCIEPVRVARPVHLAPGEKFSGTFTVKAE